MKLGIAGIAGIVVGLTATSWAHKPGDAHVQLALTGERLDGTVAVALRDLEGALDLDANGDGEITWREALAASPRIDAYARARLAVSADGSPCTLAYAAGRLSDYSDGAYWSMPLIGRCANDADTLTVAYSLLFDIDAQHRGIVQVRTARGIRTVIVRDATPIAIHVGDAGAVAAAGFGFASVWTNLAALCCFVCLLVPALVERKQGAWRAAPRRTATSNVRSSIAAFVLGSTATTLAATAGLVALPRHAVAIAVVLTVAVAAASNLVRTSPARWDLAFELGLLHGIAASFVLASLVPTRISTILGFVVGIVAAEVVVASMLAMCLYAARHVVARRGVVWAWSGATAAMAIVWACWIT